MTLWQDNSPTLLPHPPWHHHSHTHCHHNHPCCQHSHLWHRNNSPTSDIGVCITTHLCCLTPSASTATHITLTADTATYGAGTTHTNTRHTDVCILVNYGHHTDCNILWHQHSHCQQHALIPPMVPYNHQHSHWRQQQQHTSNNAFYIITSLSMPISVDIMPLMWYLPIIWPSFPLLCNEGIVLFYLLIL